MSSWSTPHRVPSSSLRNRQRCLPVPTATVGHEADGRFASPHGDPLRRFGNIPDSATAVPVAPSPPSAASSRRDLSRRPPCATLPVPARPTYLHGSCTVCTPHSSPSRVVFLITPACVPNGYFERPPTRRAAPMIGTARRLLHLSRAYNALAYSMSHASVPGNCLRRPSNAKPIFS